MKKHFSRILVKKYLPVQMAIILTFSFVNR